MNRVLRWLNRYLLIFCPKCGGLMLPRDNCGVAHCSKCSWRE